MRQGEDRLAGLFQHDGSLDAAGRTGNRHGSRDDGLAFGAAAVPGHRVAAGQRLAQRGIGDAARRTLRRIRRILALEEPTK
jgi:hypothetical protein